MMGKAAAYGCHQPTQAPVLILAALLPIQLIDNIPGKAVVEDPSPWGPCTHMGDPEQHLARGFRLA